MISQVQALLDPLDRSSTECDGMTRLCHTVLEQHYIPHAVFLGICHYQSQRVQTHFWIDLGGALHGWRVDYRLRMWFKVGTEALPHGVFQPERFPQVQCLGNPVEMELLSDGLFQFLRMDTTPWLLSLTQKKRAGAARESSGSTVSSHRQERQD